MPRALVGLGSNLGDRRRSLDDAAAALADLPHTAVVARSAWYETPPIGGPPGQAAFLNGAVLLESDLAPQLLLAEFLRIEGSLGRTRDVAWGPRPLDLDLLLYDDVVLREAALTVPHPRLSFRKFVLRGAVEIAAAMRHPVLERTLGELHAHLESAPRYVALVGRTQGFRSQLAAEAADAAQARLVEPTAAGVPTSPDEFDPHSLTAAAAIEFMQARTEAVKRSFVEAGPAWIVDDAWPAAEAVALTLRLPEVERRRFVAAWSELEAGLPTPRLLVAVGTASSASAEGPQGVRRAAPFDVLLPPTVDVNLADREAALIEIAAALAAAT